MPAQPAPRIPAAEVPADRAGAGRAAPDDTRRGPLTARGEDKRRRIVDAAASVLARQGYAGTTLADIAEAAGTHAGSLYYHFSSREELAAEVLTSGARAAFAHTTAAVAALPAHVDARRRLETAIVAHVGFMLERSPAAMASVRAVGQVPPAVAGPLQVVFVAYGRFFAGLFEAAVAEGFLDPSVDIRAARLLVLGAANWSPEWFDPAGPSPAEAVGTLLCRMVFGGLTPPATG